MSDTSREMDEIKSQVRDLTNQVKRLSRSAQSDLSEEASEYMNEMRSNMREKWEQAADSTREAGQKVHRYAKENPWHVAALAGVIGLAAASLFSNRKK